MFLSILFPAYNEAERIQAAITRTVKQFTGIKADLEIIVINNGSTDNTIQAAGSAALEALKDPRKTGNITYSIIESEKGKGAAVREGLRAARGTWILVTDVDLATPPAEVYKLLEAALKAPKADIVIGSRKLAGSLVLGFGIRRRISSWIFSILARTITPVPFNIRDTQCGFKLLSAAAAADLAPRLTMTGFVYDVELLAAARLNGYRIKEIPVIWSHDPDSKVNLFTDSFNMALDLVEISLKAARNEYTR